MRVFPDSAAEDIGLAPVLERLQWHLSSKRVRTVAASLEYCETVEDCLERLRLASELQNCLTQDDPIPFQAGDDLRPALERARPEGAALSSDEFVLIRHIASTARVCQSFFRSRAELYPGVADMFSRMVSSREMEDAISTVYDDEGNMRDNASPGLRRIRRELQNVRSSLRKSIMRLLGEAASNGYATEDQPTVRSGRMVIPIRAEAKRKISGFVQDVSATGQTVYIEPAECLDLNNRIRELETEEKREIETIRRGLTDIVRENTESLRTATDVLDEFELRKGIAQLANELNAVVPLFNSDGKIDIVDGRSAELLLHFQNEARQEREQDSAFREVVPLNLVLGNPDRSLVISGPNAGGKSVALKTVGVFQLMLGLGIPIPVADTSSFPFFESVFIDIGDSQSVEDDLSTYSSHLARLKTVLENADHASLVLVDEAGSGTDPEEGSALFQAVLELLIDVRAFTVITTHHGALKYFAHETEGVENGSMVFDQESLTPTFVFHQGEPGSSYATEMAQRVGFPSSVLERARALLGSDKADVSSLLSRLSGLISEQERAVDEATLARVEAGKVKQQFEEKLGTIREEQGRIKNEAIAEARHIVKNANRTIEQAVRTIKESQAAKEQTKTARRSVEALKTDLENAARHQERKIASIKSKLERPSSKKQPRKTRKTADGKRPKKEGSQTNVHASVSGKSALMVGDRVIIDGGAVVGELSEIKKNKAVVLFGSAQTRVEIDRLTRVAGPEKQNVIVRQTRTVGSAPSIAHAKIRLDARGMRVSEALSEVTALLDQATVSGLKTVEILHGKGTGALREAIHEYAASRPDVTRVEEAQPEQGGSGVSFVWLAE